MEQARPTRLRIFVYGSLKRGYRNHTAYCQGYDSTREATVVGRLFRQADGYPMLIVPPPAILAYGTSDIAADCETLAQFEQQVTEQNVQMGEFRADAAEEDWQAIRGELYEWSTIDTTKGSDILTRLDQLEDYYPGDQTPGRQPSLYHRVIVIARHAKGVEPAWTFVAPQGTLPPGTTPMGRSWP